MFFTVFSGRLRLRFWQFRRFSFDQNVLFRTFDVSRFDLFGQPKFPEMLVKWGALENDVFIFAVVCRHFGGLWVTLWWRLSDALKLLDPVRIKNRFPMQFQQEIFFYFQTAAACDSDVMFCVIPCVNQSLELNDALVMSSVASVTFHISSLKN